MPPGPIYLPPHQFVTAAVLDFLVLAGWLLLIVGPRPIARRRAPYILLALLTIAAGWYTPRRHAPSYPPPPQKTANFPPVSLILSVHDSPIAEPWASVADVLDPAKGSPWTWTGAHPRFRFLLDESRRWMFHARLFTAGKVLRAVGPQTIRIRINGIPARAIQASEAREYELRFPADPLLIKLGMLNDVEMDIAPAYVAEDGVKLGVLLHSIGFIEDTDR